MKRRLRLKKMNPDKNVKIAICYLGCKQGS